MPNRNTAAWLAVCVAFCGTAEGLRTVAYRDVGGIPSACFGETHGIKMGDTFTRAQCEAMLRDKLERVYGPIVDRCIHHPLPAQRKAAYTSLVYNVGEVALCGPKSSIGRKENAGDVQGACDAMLLYNKVKIAGVLVPWPGLTNRRVKERALCLSNPLLSARPFVWLSARARAGRSMAGAPGQSWPRKTPSTPALMPSALRTTPPSYAPARPNAIN